MWFPTNGLARALFCRASLSQFESNNLTWSVRLGQSDSVNSDSANLTRSIRVRSLNREPYSSLFLGNQLVLKVWDIWERQIGSRGLGMMIPGIRKVTVIPVKKSAQWNGSALEIHCHPRITVVKIDPKLFLVVGKRRKLLHQIQCRMQIGTRGK